MEVRAVWVMAALAFTSCASAPNSRTITLVVDAHGNPSFRTLQSAVESLPASGGEIVLNPGEYREKVAIAKGGVHLRGAGARAEDVVIVWSDGAVNVGGTFKSATLFVTGDDFEARNLTIQNDYSLKSNTPSQAVALAITGDRAVFERVRLLGAQDTLYAASRKCEEGQCQPSRQYFTDCYIEGHVDFIFGDAKAFFDRCEIHAIAHGAVMLTAQSKATREQDSGYVFDRCVITADAGAQRIYFGRPWRDYATVIFMNTRIDADLQPAGWSEWTPGKTSRLETAYYAEYRSTGRGGNARDREPYSHQLTQAEIGQWSARVFLSGRDGWAPSHERDE